MEVFSPGYLSDRHGAEDVEEDEGTVGKVLPQKVTMGQALDVGDGGEGQFGHNPSVKAKRNRKIKRCYKPDRKPEPEGIQFSRISLPLLTFPNVILKIPYDTC